MEKTTMTNSGIPYRAVGDILRMPEALNKVAQEHIDEGYCVSRTAFGVVIVNLDDGEIHYYPDGNVIRMTVFQRAGVVEVE